MLENSFRFSLHRILGIILIGSICAVFCDAPSAKKIHKALLGCVYLSSGDSINADSGLRIVAPMKKKKLEIVEDAYTKSSRVWRKVDPEQTDSVVLWTSTSPERPHTLIYLKDLGWCWEVERTPYVTVYCYAPGGYSFAGNGGLWMIGKSNMLVIKDGKRYSFGRPDKKIDNKMRAKLAELFGDDPIFMEYLRKAIGRRDKILRSLVNYTPNLIY